MNWMQKLMQGRYGLDKLGLFSLRTALVILILQLFLRTSFLTAISTVLLIFVYFRCFSKNHQKRWEENRKFLVHWEPVERRLRVRLRQIKELRTHKYFRCSTCRQIIRVPRKKGTIEVRCPKCNTKFQTKT